MIPLTNDIQQLIATGAVVFCIAGLLPIMIALSLTKTLDRIFDAFSIKRKFPTLDSYQIAEWSPSEREIDFS